MDTLFRPVMALLDRFRYPWKFAIIGLVCVLGSAALMAQIYVGLSKDIRFTEREVAGLALLDKGFSVLVQSQQHRGLSSGVLGGSEELRPRLAERGAAVREALTAVDRELESLPEWAPLRERWNGLRGRLQTLVDDGLRLPAPDNFRAHTEVIEGVLSWIGDIGDVSNLSLDPEGDSYNLIEPMLRSIPDMTERLGRLRGRATGLIARGTLSPSDEHAIVAQLAELGMTEAQLKDRLNRAARENDTLSTPLGTAMTEIDAAVGRFRDTARREVLEQGFAMPAGAFFEVGTAAIDAVLKHYGNSIRPAAERLLNSRLEELRENMIRNVVLSTLALLVAAYLFGGIYFSIVRSVRELTRGAQAFSSGNYRARVDFSAQDELRRVADSFNGMAREVAELISRIQQGAEQVGRASADVSVAANQVAEGSSTQSEAAAGMAAAIEQMTVGIDEISRHASTAQELAQKSDSLSGEGGEVMVRTVAEMERIADAVNSSAAAIGELGDKARQINSMVVAIKQIADQTNLLALNAAIEAARAGESGRGFAVVADEVRKLAERTAGATEEITEMASSIQLGTERAVDSMQAGVVRVREGASLTTRAGKSMDEINSGSREVLRAVSDISFALREQSSASAEIARNVERIAQMTEENSCAVRDTARTASTLQALAAELEQRVERFQV